MTCREGYFECHYTGYGVSGHIQEPHNKAPKPHDQSECIRIHCQNKDP